MSRGVRASPTNESPCLMTVVRCVVPLARPHTVSRNGSLVGRSTIDIASMAATPWPRWFDSTPVRRRERSFLFVPTVQVLSRIQERHTSPSATNHRVSRFVPEMERPSTASCRYSLQRTGVLQDGGKKGGGAQTDPSDDVRSSTRAASPQCTHRERK